MIYIVTHGSYSDYSIECVVERDAPVTPEETAQMQRDHAQYKTAENWADILCTKYGFRRVSFAEFWSDYDSTPNSLQRVLEVTERDEQGREVSRTMAPPRALPLTPPRA